MTIQFANHTPIIRLSHTRRRLEQKIMRFEAKLRARIDPDIDEADPGLTEQTVTLALLNNAREKLASIDRALRQAQNGGYGRCEQCEQPINSERLEIFPQATLCVTCKSTLEARFPRRLAA